MIDEGRLRVACAVPYALDTVPGQRFRWEQWAPLLRSEGVDVSFIPFGTRALQAARDAGRSLSAVTQGVRRLAPWSWELAAARRMDVLVVQRNAALTGPPVAEFLLTRAGMPLVYDFDDAVHLPPPRGDTFVRRALRADWRVATLCRRAALVAAGNPVLAEYASRFSDNVEVWPTTISMSAYTERPPRPPAGLPVVGWSGSTSTAQCLTPLLPLLRELQSKVRFRLLVVGAQIDLQGVVGESRPWSPSTELSSLHEMDLGLMPLEDTPWSRGKCALKALQYLGVGIPAVVSDVGVNSTAVPHGQCGYVVRTDADWTEALLALLNDPVLRANFGAAGRKHVSANYSAEAWAPRIAEKLRVVAMRSHGRSAPSGSGVAQ